MGIAVCSLGHSHPIIVNTLVAQAKKLIHVSNLYHTEEQRLLAEEIVLNQVRLPGKVFFSNSGAEANDGLIKLAKRFGHAKPAQDGSPRDEILTFSHSFHGRTLGSMAATAQAKVHEGFTPLMPGFRYLPFNDAKALEDNISPRTAALLVEPIQGEGGVNVASREFLTALNRVRQKYDLLLFFDEVQAGFGRCGPAMAWRAISEEIEPDGISWAKGIGGGVPIGAFWVSDRDYAQPDTPISALMGPGSHGSTYGGNPLMCAISLAVIRETSSEHIQQNIKQRSQQIFEQLECLKSTSIKEVRGMGLLIGIELNAEGLKAPRDGETLAIHLTKHLISNGLLVVPAGPNTVRLLPPLNVTDSEVDEALDILRDTLEDIFLK